MLGSTDPYDYVHTFWSDQYEHKLEYAGHATEWDDFVIRGSLEDGELVGFYLQEGRLLAAVGVDRGGDPELDTDSEMAAAARLVGMRTEPDAGRLADEGTDLGRSRSDARPPAYSFEKRGMFAPLAATRPVSIRATTSSATSAGVRPGRSAGLA